MRALILFLSGFAILATLGSLLIFSRSITSFDGPHFNRDRNAVWMGHRWIEGDVDEGEIASQLQFLAKHGIGYLYVHVGPLGSDGRIPEERYRSAPRFIRIAKQASPSVKLLAWIGQIERSGGGILDLRHVATRRNVAEEAAAFTRDLGFDGVHIDIEPVLDGNADYLDLLELTERSIDDDKLLSTVAHVWVPEAFMPPLLRQVYQPGAAWSDRFFREVDKRVDQIAVMVYDTASPWPYVYTQFVKFQTSHILNTVSSAEVLIGVPTYKRATWSHHPDAENIESGLQGVIAGLNSSNKIDNFAGVAIYPLWETSDADWETFRRLWLGRN